MTGRSPDDFELLLGRLLGYGVRASAVVLTFGLVVLFAGASPRAADRLMRAGLVMLMAIPVLRVVASVLEYAVRRDWFFFATTLAVLGVLLATIGVAVGR